MPVILLIVSSWNRSMKSLMISPSYGLVKKESVHVHANLFLKEAAKEEHLQVIPAGDGTFWQFAKPFESYALEDTNEQLGQYKIIPYYIFSLRMKVVYMLLSWTPYHRRY